MTNQKVIHLVFWKILASHAVFCKAHENPKINILVFISISENKCSMFKFPDQYSLLLFVNQDISIEFF